MPPDVLREHSRAPADRIGWPDIFEAWVCVETDLHATFGIDLDAPVERTWRWLRARIVALAAMPDTRTFHALRRAKGARRDA